MAALKSQYITGKGNVGMYIDRCPKIYAAGIRSKQPYLRVVDCLNNVLVQSSVNEGQNKKILLQTLEHVRSTVCKDMRNAGPFTESSELINPPVNTKFQTLIEDLKTTVYQSYWNKQVGERADLTFCTPPDLDIHNTTFGKKSTTFDNAYDIVMPKTSSSEFKKLSAKCPGYQFERNYCKSSFNPNITYGLKTNCDKRGQFVKHCLTDDITRMGNSLKQPILTCQQTFQLRSRAQLETGLSPNKNISCVPKGHTFGKAEPKDANNVLGCLTYYEINPEKELLYKCLAHLNTLRKCLSKRFNGQFFHNLYLQLRYLDKSLCCWLPKELIYHSCTTRRIRFTPSLIEPLLKMWKAINDSNIEYKTFINIINYREPLPELLKIWDISSEFTDYNTTYTEMSKQQPQNMDFRAGLPSGGYLDKTYPVTPDGCCKADRSYLSQESDAKTCLSPSIFTLLGVSHRDMYTERDPDKVKRVFQAAGEDIDEYTFSTIWNCATTYHPKRLVCYETFRCALNEYKSKLNEVKPNC